MKLKNRIGNAIIFIGTMHTALGVFRFHGEFVAMFLEGLLSSGAGDLRGWAFWFTLAGLLMITLGLSVQAIERQDAAIPVSLGWVLLFSSIIGAIVYPVSGFWLMLAVSLLILFGRRESTMEEST